MKKTLDVIRWFVGDEHGYFDEGNIQWYYVMGMVISNLILWKLNFNDALVFMLLSTIHFVTIYLYGGLGLQDFKKAWTVAFWAIHFAIGIICLCINASAAFWSFVFIILLISVGDMQESCALPPNSRLYNMCVNAIIFGIFLMSVCLLPIACWYKVLMVVVELIIHPVVDYLQQDVAIVTDVANNAWKRLKTK